MRHALRYEGGFERNYSQLRAGATEFQSDEGASQPVPAWPEHATGLRFGFMEQPGKRFVAVRVGMGDQEVVLQHPVIIDQMRHLGGKRFGAEPITVDDRSASDLFGEVLSANPEQRNELTALRDRVREMLDSERK